MATKLFVSGRQSIEQLEDQLENQFTRKDQRRAKEIASNKAIRNRRLQPQVAQQQQPDRRRGA